ncbi:MAG TPA: thioredoxin domain-containing protein [Caulobacteraceae bacterium]|nr:thioredoxin domain-containing protein [Caulobacteraceae bacterium]
MTKPTFLPGALRRRRSAAPAAALWLACALASSAVAAAGPPAREPDDESLGSARAPVTVIEYGSVGCPHCAAWAQTVFPEFKKRLIDTGKVRFVMREELTGEPVLAAAGFLLARCAGPQKYFDVVDKVFAAQPQIFASGEALTSLTAIAKSEGMDEAALKACVTNKAALDALEARAQRHAVEDGVSATPTFMIGQTKLVGDQSLDKLEAAVAAARRR